MSPHPEVESHGAVGHYFHMVSDGQSCSRDRQRVGFSSKFQAVVSLAVGIRKAEDAAPARPAWRHGDVCLDGMSQRIEHGALYDCLRVERPSERDDGGNECRSMHIESVFIV